MRATKLLALASLSAVLTFDEAVAQELIADDFDLEETVNICAACHGEGGVPVEGDIPVLWGQQFYYLYVQMKDYKAGRRANMCNLVRNTCYSWKFPTRGLPFPWSSP